MTLLSNKEIGQLCKEYRQSINMKQIDVARDTEYSLESISSFENGRTNNMRIFIWYIMHGFNFENTVTLKWEDLEYERGKEL